MIISDFVNPETILRPAPFWAINSKLSPERCARQMEDMLRVGLSGGFFHSRHGLVTDYMGEEWFEAMNAALDAARKNGGYLWLYDEDLWPSGNAGGQVAGARDDYRSATINACLVPPGEDTPPTDEDSALKYCYVIRKRDGLNLQDFEPVPIEEAAGYRGFERVFLIRKFAPKTGWWSGESYANLMNPQAMKLFVELTHERYARRLGHEFGKLIPGIFTDEPQLAHASNGIAWYEGIPEIYSKWVGRDWSRDVLFMFFDGPEAREIRLLMHRTILRQFVEAYSRPLFEWCESHNLEHTGHYNAEDDFVSQIMCHYGGIMAHYRYQQAPGIDHLCRQIDGFVYGAGPLLTCKQVSSAARQFGRSRAMSEIFGVSRHTNTFEDFKWLGDFNLVCGVNFFVPHLSWYSAAGRRKRDYPPVWNASQTYWDELKPLNDYFTRIAYALTRGKAAVDVLMLHSIEGATATHRLACEVWSTCTNATCGAPLQSAPGTLEHIAQEDWSQVSVMDAQMRNSLEAVLSTGYDCDLGDEGFIEDTGRIDGASFVVGEMAYKIVILPPSATWRPRTFELLKQFIGNGGKVVILGELPSEIDCRQARQKWGALTPCENVYQIPCEASSLQHLVYALMEGSFILSDSDGKAACSTYCQHRIDGDEDIFFITNADRARSCKYILRLRNADGRRLFRWDAVAGSRELITGETVEGELGCEFTLAPCGSILLTLEDSDYLANETRDNQAPAVAANGAGQDDPYRESAAGYSGTSHEKKTIALRSAFDFERSESNVLVIDRLSVSFDDGTTFGPEDLDHRVRSRIAEQFGTADALLWQPWVAMRKGVFDNKGGRIVLRYRFESVLEKPKAFAVIENMSAGELRVNGEMLDITNASWHWDRAFDKVEITNLVKDGENTMDFAFNYDFLSEVEAAYVVGDFGVEIVDAIRGRIVAEPEKIEVGSWTDQGYPFYTGKMTYKTSFEADSPSRAVLRLARPSGTLFKVRVNGREAGRLFWRPWILDISRYVQEGKNDIEIEFVSSLQNAWGPRHEIVGDDNLWCGPNAFEDDSILREQINSYPYGLLGGAEIVLWRPV